MKKSIFAILLAVCLGALNASADKKVVNVKSNYSTLSASAGAIVKYVPESSKTTVIEINGPADKINWVEVSVRDNTLSIRPKEDHDGNRNGSRIRGVTITVFGPLVKNFRASSSGKIISNTWFEFRKSTLSLSASSSGEIKLANVSSPALIAKASSSGEIEINSVNSSSVTLKSSSSGEIEINNVQGKNLSASASSSSDIEIDAVSCGNVSLAASSSGDVKIPSVTAGNLSASASSSGDVTVGGRADRATLSASSGGDINARRLSCSNSTIRSSSGGSIYER